MKSCIIEVLAPILSLIWKLFEVNIRNKKTGFCLWSVWSKVAAYSSVSCKLNNWPTFDGVLHLIVLLKYQTTSEPYCFFSCTVHVRVYWYVIYSSATCRKERFSTSSATQQHQCYRFEDDRYYIELIVIKLKLMS